MHLKNILSMAGMIFLLSACNSGNESNEIEQLATSINTQFAAVYSQGIKKRDLNSLNDSSEVALQSPEQQNTDKRFLGELQVVDVVAAQTQVLNWAVTLRSDGVVESHGTVALSPGTYDFKMTLERDSKQYVAESLGVEVAGDGSADILLTLLPNLADTITPEGDVEYTSTISFEYPAEDLVNLIDPKFGLILNNGDELIFDINKEVGITKFILNVDAGSHQIALNLYDGSQLVGHDTGTQAIDLSENENVTLDIISLQSDITFDVDRLVENGEFIFNVPNVIVDEVGGEENLAVLVKMAAGNNPLQEKILEVINVEGKYQASDNFVTYGENSVTVSIDYYDQAELVDGLSGLPFATCTTQISVTSSQAVTCKYFLERSSVISGRLLGSIMLNVMETNGTPAIGAEVYLNNKLVGLTGENYQHGGLKTHQVAGDYELNVVRPDGRHHSSFTLNPLQVLNLSVVLDSHFSVDEIQYVDSNKEIDLSDAYKSTQYRMRLEDFNRDGFVDIYYSRNSFNTSDVVLLNDGTGNFSSQVELERYSSQTVLEDLSPVASGVHNDENYLFVFDYYRNPTAIVYHYQGEGRFGVYDYLPLSTHVLVEQFSDLDGNGTLDLITSDYSPTGEFKIYLNDTESKFDKTPSFIIPNPGCISGDSPMTRIENFEVVDMNGDGIKDIVYACAFTIDDETTFGGILLGIGNGDFSHTPSTVFEGVSSHRVEIWDITGNGNPDVIASPSIHHYLPILYKNNEDHSLTPHAIREAYPPHHRPYFRARDLNNDGTVEILEIENTHEFKGTNYYRITKDQGIVKQGVLNLPKDCEGICDLELVDFNNDGLLDVFVEDHYHDKGDIYFAQYP